MRRRKDSLLSLLLYLIMRYWEEQDGSIFHKERKQKMERKIDSIDKRKDDGEDKRRRECDWEANMIWWPLHFSRVFKTYLNLLWQTMDEAHTWPGIVPFRWVNWDKFGERLINTAKNIVLSCFDIREHFKDKNKCLKITFIFPKQVGLIQSSKYLTH